MAARSRGTRTAHIALALALLVCPAAASGCGLFSRDGGPTAPPGTGTGAGPVTSTPLPPPRETGSQVTTPEPPPRQLGLRIYLAYQEKVQPVYRSVPGTSAVIRAAITELLRGATAVERARGLSSAVPSATRLRSVALRDGIAYVDLTGTFDDGGGTLSITLRLAQLTYTVTQFPGVKAMVLKMDGHVVDVFSGEGIELAGQPQKRSDYEYATPAILLDMPAWGATEHDPAYLKGTANVFEARFTLELIGPDGHVIATEQVTASSGSGTRGTWMASVPYHIPASGWGKVRVYDASPKDGKPQDVVVVPVYFGK